MTCEEVSYKESVLNPRSSLAVFGVSVSTLKMNVGKLNRFVEAQNMSRSKKPIQHILTCEPDETIKILLSETLTERDILYAYVHGFYFRKILRESKYINGIIQTQSLSLKSLWVTEEMFEEFYETLKANKWDLTKILVPRKEWRVNFDLN